MAFSWFRKRKISIDLSGKKGSAIFSWKRITLLPIFFFLFLSAAFSTYYFYSKYHALAEASERQVPPSADPVQSVIGAVDKHLLLPGGEVPVLAKVSNLEPLAAYPFFRNAIVGDEVLVYCKHGLSVLYSPAREKVIEVATEALAGACPTSR